jgi:hypothetical protein
MSPWTHAVEDVLHSALEQRRGWWRMASSLPRAELVKLAGALLLRVQEIDEAKREAKT